MDRNKGPEYTQALLDQLSPSGLGAASALSGEQRELYLHLNFAAKEALTKAIGQGLPYGLASVSFEPELPHHWAVEGGEEHTVFDVVFRKSLDQHGQWGPPGGPLRDKHAGICPPLQPQGRKRTRD